MQKTKGNPTDAEQKATVLVVEDDEGLNHLIRKTLTREGYEMQQALTGSEAIASLIKDPNKILLLDYLLPDMTGAQVIRAVREEKLEVPLIIMTGHGDEKVAVDMMKQGVRDYVVKESGFIDSLPNILRRVSNELATEKELARVEKALRLAAKEWQMTFDGISDAICLLDNEMKITQCNNAMSKFLQKEPEEIIGHQCYELVHCTKEPIEDCPIVRMKKTKQREQKVLNVEDKRLDIVAHPLFDEKGVLNGAVHLISDITERKQTEELKNKHADELSFLGESAIKFVELSREENIHDLIGNQLKKIVDESAVVVISEFDKDSKVFSAKAMLGIEKELKFLKDVLHQDPRRMAVAPVGNELQEALTSGKLSKVDGGVYEISGRSIPKLAAKGIEKFMKFDKIYAMGLRRGGEIYGNICIIFRKGKKLTNAELIEAFINQASVALERRWAEEELRESRDYLEKLTDSMWDAVFSVKMPERIIEWANDSFRLIGYESGEFIGKTTDFIYADKSEYLDFGKKLKSTIAAGKDVLHAEQLLKRRNGDIFPAEITSTIFREKGEIVRVTSIVRDITERKRSEESLCETRGYLDNLFNYANAPIIVWNPEGRITRFNHAFEHLSGYTASEVVGQELCMLLPEENQDELMSKIASTVSGEYWESVEISILRKDGDIRDAIWNSANVYAEDKTTLLSTIAQGLDITEHKRMVESLRESEEKFRSLVENAPNIILIVDRENIIQFINHTVPGLSIDEVIGRNHTDFVTPEYHKTVNKEIGRVFKTGKPGRYETGGAGPDGSHSWYSSLLGPIMHNGKVNAVMIVTTDITERKHAEEEKAKLQDQLQQSQKMEAIGQLAGGIAHDFNNLLGGISGYSDVLKIKMDQDSGLVKYVQKIQDAAIKAAGLTHQLLTFARKARVSMATVDIHNAIDQALGILERTIDRRIEIERHLDAQTSTVVGDTSLIENALLNLAINARDAMPDGGFLTLATEVVYLKQSWFRGQTFDGMPGVYLKVSVADTGIGMDETTQAKVFEPFFTTKEPGKGTGLGLASVYGCVKQHNGYITVQSEPGKGSRFTLFLPLSESAVEEVKDKPELIHGEGTVLVVDDEIIMREAASDMLIELGYKVMSCENGFEAVEYFEKNYKETDAVLLDMMMPKMNGVDCYRKLKEINPQVRVIIASGYSDEKQDIQIKELGVKDFIEKPFKISKLSRCIADLLAKGSE